MTRIRLLGPIIVDGERLIASTRPQGGNLKQRKVFAMLALNPGKRIKHDDLYEELWSDNPPKSFIGTFQTYVYQLRKILPKDINIVSYPGGYKLEIDSVLEIDTVLFDSLFYKARVERRKGDLESADKYICDALELCQDGPLEDIVPGSILTREINLINNKLVSAIVMHVEMAMDLGMCLEIIPELQILVKDNWHREDAAYLLMLALYRSNRRAESLQAFQDTKQNLINNLGIEPNKAIRELYQQILVEDPRLDELKYELV